MLTVPEALPGAITTFCKLLVSVTVNCSVPSQSVSSMIGILTHIIEPLFAALNTSGWDTGLKSRLAIYMIFENNIRGRISDRYNIL